MGDKEGITGFPADFTKLLQDNGADLLAEGQARITLPAAKVVDVISYIETDTTSRIRNLRQNHIRNIRDRNIESRQVFGGSGALFKKVCLKYKVPKFSFRILPLHIANLTLKILPGTLEGDIVNELKSESEDGERGRLSQWRFRNCPKDERLFQWSTVPGSGDLAPQWIHDMVETDTNSRIGRVRQQLASLRPGDLTSVSAKFVSKGLKDVIRDLFAILLRGRVTLLNGYEVTMNFKWKNETQTFTRNVKAIARIPVIGSLDIDWK